MRGYNLDIEEAYDKMFNADERQRNEWVMLEAQESAWYLNDIMLGKHFSPDFGYNVYGLSTD